MAKMTKKYSVALHTILLLGKKQPLDQPAEIAYQMLADAGYQWDSKQGKWLKLAALPANPASNLLRVRVWAAKEDVQHHAKMIAGGICVAGYELLEMSEAYPCRPPKQNESRIYLTLIKK